MIPKWANYVARNEDGELRAFNNEPYRSENGFWLWQENNMVDYGSTLHESDDGFSDVLWTDGKAVRVEREVKSDPIKPDHYRKGGLETFDIMKLLLTEEEFRGYLKGNVIKYRERAEYKGNAEEDYKKAKEYYDILVEVQNE